MWNLTTLGKGYAVLGSIAERAEAAYGEMAAAQAALATSDIGGSQKHFQNAADLLASARAQLKEAVNSSTYVIDYLEVSGTIASGDQLLVAGESVVEAGSQVAEGLGFILAGKVLPPEQEEDVGEVALPLVMALESALDSFAKAHAALVDAEAALNRVQTLTLPADVKERVQLMQKTIPAGRELLGAFLDQSHVLLSILGATADRQYLILFENNHEIRPTGGFIGSLGLLNVNRGVVEDIDVQTVYDGDGQLKEFIAPPDPLLNITDRWYLRDANWFVDFPTSAEKIVNFFEKEGGPTVDGVIALTPEVIKKLLTITGPIEMPEYDVVVDADSFVPLTQDLVTYSYDREVNRPKQFLADVTPVLLNRLFADGTDILPVLSVLSDMAREKQLLVYFTDTDEQARIARQGWSGTLPEDAPNFLNVVNANIGGHKSDQFMSQEIDYRLNVADDGGTEALVTIRRTHNGPTEKLDLPYPPDDNPAFKDNIIYQRVLVPKGAQLIEAIGFTAAADVPKHFTPNEVVAVTPDADVAEWQRQQQHDDSGTIIGEESGYRYFANWVVTKPGATTVALYRYRLPDMVNLPQGFNMAETVAAYVAKQPGDTRTELRIEMQLPKKFQVVHTVPNDGVTRGETDTLAYRGRLRSDVLFGAVIERK